ncbi:hypothetical protein Tsubulata_010660 [Turnera subulata]|uniref:Uncharacterized protein n=1 Tax=Turnera subulata TaxID=218843 RepID=A0A9Q0FMG1_9ROSI|nr:hypothetical protein Tsubulata_010660 [Turnera subulata]
MEKEGAVKQITASLNKVDLQNPNLSPLKSAHSTPTTTTLQFSSKLARQKPQKQRPPSLVSLCLGVVGENLEDIVADLSEIASGFPAHIKIGIAAIARRRKLLCDDVLIPLADSSWEILDVSGSDVSDLGLVKVAETCRFLRAVDISRCDNITAAGVSELVRHCKLLQILRCGGCPKSDRTARSSLGVLKPKLHEIEEDSWEDLDTAEIGHGAESLCWLVWPKIDADSLEILANECPRIIVNPKPSLFGYRGVEVPVEAMSDVALDSHFIKGIDPKTWAVRGFTPNTGSGSISPLDSTELSIAEKFRLAFLERDTRLAPKRAKNARQHQRRVERQWMMMSAEAKAIALASKVGKSRNSKN